MAKLEPVYESMDAVPESQREFYTDVEGKAVLDTDVEKHPGLQGLKSAYGKEREAGKVHKTKITQLETQIAELKTQIEEKKDEGKGTGDLEKLLAKKEAEVKAQYEPIKTELEQLKGTLAKRDRNEAIRKASAEAGIMPDRYEDALIAAERYLEFKDGKLAVLDDDGDPTGIDPKKWFAETFKQKKPWFFQGTGSTGGGTPAGGTGGAGGTITLTPAQAGDYPTYQDALKKVNGDHSKIRVVQPQQ